MEAHHLESQVEAALNTMRPYLHKDGGDVSIYEITPDYVVRLKLLGTCSTCPQSYMTMKAGIEEAILRMVPGITKVEAVSMPPEDPFKDIIDEL